MKIVEIPLTKIKPDPNQPRKTFNPDKIQELAQTIKTTGIINPIEVDSSYMIITGENRYRAAKVAGLTKTWVKVLDLDDKDRFMRQVIENIQYANLTPHEIASALKVLLSSSPGKLDRDKKHQGDRYQIGITELAEKLGKSKSWIQEHLNLLQASRPIQTAVKGGLPMSHLRAINQIPEPLQAKMEKKILAGEFNSRDGAVAVAQAINRDPEKAKEILAKDYSQYKTTQDISEALAKISPRLSDIVTVGQPPYDRIQAIAKELYSWLDKTTPQDIGQMRIKGVLLTLSSMKTEIDQWVLGHKVLTDSRRLLK